MAYGTDSDVAALVPMWTNEGSFDGTTLPTLDQVNSWINQVSAVADLSMRNAGFTVPVTEPTTVSVLQLFVTTAVADLVAYTNKAGRFYETQQLGSSRNPLSVVTAELKTLVESLASGLEAAGADRDNGLTDGMGFRLYDEDGDYIPPMFQRKFANWKVRDVYNR